MELKVFEIFEVYDAFQQIGANDLRPGTKLFQATIGEWSNDAVVSHLAFSW